MALKIFSVLVLLTLAVQPALAQNIKLAPDCDPAKAPNEKGSCDLNAFITWIKRIVEILLIIAIPVGIVFIFYGGFVIMTAGGSGDKAKKGKDIILAAATGLAIAFGAWLIVTTVKQILGI